MKRMVLVKKRLEKGLSQTDLAKRVGLSTAVVFRIENGGYSRPANILKLALAYGIPVAEFVEALFKLEEGEDNG